MSKMAWFFVPTGRALISKIYEMKLNNPLRLQIFKDGQLVGDHPVPGRFRILGKIGERYVADGLFDERNEQQGFYLMTIN